MTSLFISLQKKSLFNLEMEYATFIFIYASFYNVFALIFISNRFSSSHLLPEYLFFVSHNYDLCINEFRSRRTLINSVTITESIVNAFNMKIQESLILLQIKSMGYLTSSYCTKSKLLKLINLQITKIIFITFFFLFFGAFHFPGPLVSISIFHSLPKF